VELNKIWQTTTALLAMFASMHFGSQLGYGQMIVGHRGASYDAPENTLAAFKEAWAQGADGVEGDFYLTKDGQIVCIHDKDTKRTGGEKLVVAESTLEELRQLEYGAWKGEQFRGERLPTFAEVLAAVPEDKTFVIELKTGPEIVPVLKEELQRLGASRRKLLLIAFRVDTVAACKEQMPEIRAHWLTGYKQDKETGQWTPTVDEVAAQFAASKADGIGTQGNRNLVTADFISKLRQQGMREFHVWTVNDAADANYFRELGAIGITTDRPAFIRESLSL
jgi:glycerophosphoryl diester phosphodiesterase